MSNSSDRTSGGSRVNPPADVQPEGLSREGEKKPFPTSGQQSKGTAREYGIRTTQFVAFGPRGDTACTLAERLHRSNIQLAFSSASCACMHDVSPKVGFTSCVMLFCIRMFGEKVKHSSPLSSRSPSRDVFLAYRDYISARILMHPAEVPETILLHSGTIAIEPPAVGDGPKIAATRGLQHCIAWGIGAPKTLHCSVHRF